jgi:hypothetical protein
MKKFHKMELKSPSIPLFPPGQRPKGETPISLPFVSDPERSLTRRVKGGAAVQSQTMAPDGGEGLFLFQKAKFIRNFFSVSRFLERSFLIGYKPSGA